MAFKVKLKMQQILPGFSIIPECDQYVVKDAFIDLVISGPAIGERKCTLINTVATPQGCEVFDSKVLNLLIVKKFIEMQGVHIDQIKWSQAFAIDNYCEDSSF